jgi:hypothetical protein
VVRDGEITRADGVVLLGGSLRGVLGEAMREVEPGDEGKSLIPRLPRVELRVVSSVWRSTLAWRRASAVRVRSTRSVRPTVVVRRLPLKVLSEDTTAADELPARTRRVCSARVLGGRAVSPASRLR